jgi:uncharacterized protein YbjT (DUF2867 family)
LENAKNKVIAVLGATGYVGGRLVPRLLEAGYYIRAISRSVQKLKSRPWADNPNVEIVSADVLDKNSLNSALNGCIAAYYLVHSMNPSHADFSSADKQAAINMRDVSAEQGLQQIIYLGGLGEENLNLSHHLKSRAEVGKILKEGSTPVTILRAAMIIGSGSASFEILRYLVDRLPLMVTPKWIDTVSQPIAIRNVLNYLTGCLLKSEVENKTFDIGGPDVLTYRELMKIYAEECGLPKRWVIPVPVFTPKLSSYWIHLITPVPAYIAQPLAEGLKNPVVCQENKIQEIIPQELITCREAIQRALRRLTTHQIETHWTDAGKMPPPETVYPDDPNWSGGTVYKDKRTMIVQGTPEQIWKVVVAIGGETGWYYGDILWKIRGLMDRLIGGVGDRRGRRDPDTLRIGDALDFWRVLSVDVNHKLRLIAEMKVPGQAILGFQLNAIGDDKTEIIQTAWFVPAGLMGILYWYLVTPLHELVFSGMLNGIVKASKTKPLKGSL